VGKDPEARRLAALADELGVADRVILLGSVNHDAVPPVIRSADAVVTTPWYEPFGIVPLEAMSCARPVIGSAVGGLLDSVADGETGLLVPPRDPAAVADAARRLLGDQTLRRRLGRAGRQRAEERFDWARVAEQVEQAYAEVASREARRLEAV
jgi:type III pantothenate kinase